MLLLLTATVAVRFPSAVLDRQPLDDERVYLRAFELLASGESPYFGAYHYPPAFAYLGAAMVAALGPQSTLWILRAANLLGLAVVLWCAGAWLSPRQGVMAGVLMVLLSPAVALGVRWGNLSFLIGALVLVPLFMLERARPCARCRTQLSSAAILAASLVLKPVAAIVPAALIGGAHTELGARRRYWLAAAATVGLTAAILLLLPLLSEFLQRDQPAGAIGRSSSLTRLLYCLGLDLHPLAVLSIVAAPTVLLAHRLTVGPGVFLSWTLSVSLLATPIVWSHTLLLTLPTQLLALRVALERRTDPWTMRRPPVSELLLVLVSILAIQMSEGVGAIDDQPGVLQALVIAVPCFSPLALSIYLTTVRPEE